MCDFFALLLVWHDVGDARDLWQRSWRDLAQDDLRRGASEATAHNNVLHLVEQTLSRFSLTAKAYMLQPMQVENVPSTSPFANKHISKEYADEVWSTEKILEAQQTYFDLPDLTVEQQEIFDQVPNIILQSLSYTALYYAMLCHAILYYVMLY